MTVLEAIEMKRNNEERTKNARKATWREIKQVKDDKLRKELKAAYKPVNNGRKSGWRVQKGDPLGRQFFYFNYCFGCTFTVELCV